MTELPCRRDNYGGLRTGRVEYVVIHYTAGRNDTALDNGRYFAANAVGASAHYFADGQQVVRSVPEEYVAWHCGADRYRHPACRNGNSIGVELCTAVENGRRCITEDTAAMGAQLTRQLLKRYDLPVTRVLRHYDVTGKLCPEPFVRDEGQWNRFLARLEEEMTQQEFAEHMRLYLAGLSQESPREWSREARAWAEEQGLIRGDGTAMAYRRPVTREELAQILYRMKGERT